MSNEIFNGYVELNGDAGVVEVQVYKDDGHFYFYVDGDLADDVDTAEGFMREYGSKLYNDLEDFKRGNSIGAERVLV